MDLTKAIVDYLKENYDLPEENVKDCADAIENYICANVIPDIVNDYF